MHRDVYNATLCNVRMSLRACLYACSMYVTYKHLACVGKHTDAYMCQCMQIMYLYLHVKLFSWNPLTIFYLFVCLCVCVLTSAYSICLKNDSLLEMPMCVCRADTNLHIHWWTKVIRPNIIRKHVAASTSKSIQNRVDPGF